MNATARDIERRLSKIENAANPKSGVLILGPDDPIPKGCEHWHIIVDNIPVN